MRIALRTLAVLGCNRVKPFKKGLSQKQCSGVSDTFLAYKSKEKGLSQNL